MLWRTAPRAVLWTVPILVVIEFVNLQRPRLMGVHWVTSIDVLNGAYVLLAPMAAATAAFASLSVVRSRELIIALPDGGLRAYAGPSIATAAVVSVVHLSTLVVVLVLGWTDHVVGRPQPLPVLAALSSFFAAACLGTLIVRVGPTMLAPPFAALLVYGYELFEPKVGNRLFSDFGGATVLLIGLRNKTEVVIAQSAWLAAIGLLLVSLATWGWRAGVSWRSGAAVWLVAAAASLTLASLGETRFTETQIAWSCSDGTIEVCVAKEFSDELDYFAPRVARYAEALRDLGLRDVPQVFRQAVGADRPDDGYFGLDHAAAPLAFKVLESSLPCSRTWHPGDFRAVDRVVSYLVAGEGGTIDPTVPPTTRGQATAALAELRC
jgi:hypothetical protein